MAISDAPSVGTSSPLQRSITVKQLYFYVVGDVLGSGIYVLVGLVAAAVGGAFWMAFLVGVAIAAVTGLAYAELVTKYPQAAGASLYVNKAFRSAALTFFITICMLSANMAAVGSLASGFVRYFSGPARTPAMTALSFVDDARAAADTVGAEFADWGPRVHTQIRSGSPAQQIIRTAEELDAALIVLAAGSRGLSRTILLGSTASRVQHSAPCAVLVTR
jgi:nucleotide-binding universal stress UspA family protein